MPRVIHHAVKQRTPEWAALRSRHLTASMASAWAGRTQKGLPTSDCKSYVRAKAAERILSQRGVIWSMPVYESWDMRRGTELEPVALERYAVETEQLVEDGDLWEYQGDNGLVLMASPDGLVGDGLVQAKCPRANTQMTYWEYGIPEDYIWQVHVEMICAARQWCDLISYAEDAVAPLDCYIETIKFDPVIGNMLLSRAVEAEIWIRQLAQSIETKLHARIA